MATPESVIEIGSTGVRLLVAEFDADRKQNILDRSEMPLPLGKNVFTSGIVNQETQNQLIQVLKKDLLIFLLKKLFLSLKNNCKIHLWMV